MLIVIVSILIICLGVSWYALEMKGLPISEKPSDWASFSTFFSGFTTPLLSLINICVFIHLTLVLKNASDRNHNDSVRASKATTLINLKYDALNHFKEKMDSKISLWEEDFSNTSNAYEILYTYNTLEYRILFLYPELKQSKNNKNLRKYILEMLGNVKNGKENMGSRNGLRNTYGMLISEMSGLVLK